MIPVSLLSMTISKQTVQRSTSVASSQIPKKLRSQPSKVQLNPELQGPLMLSTLFQYLTSTSPLYVSMKLFKIGDNFQIQVFRSPLTSQIPNFSVLTFNFYQSSRVPPKWTFWIPHSGMHRSQSKYFLKTFIIAEVDKILSTLLVVLKSHSKLAVTPSVVFFLMAQIIRVKNSSH